jgi:hypothetical protein
MATLSTGSWLVEFAVLGGEERSWEGREPPALLREAKDWRRRSIEYERVDLGDIGPGGYMPSFRQRTRRTHGSAGNLYGAFGSTLLNLMLLAPLSLFIESQ